MAVRIMLASAFSLALAAGLLVLLPEPAAERVATRAEMLAKSPLRTPIPVACAPLPAAAAKHTDI